MSRVCCFIIVVLALIASTQSAPNSGEKHWSFQLSNRPEIPNVEDAVWCRTPLDRFVLARLELERLRPVRDADRRALIRRAYFDFIGLPPEPAAVEAFFEDRSPVAFERVVDRLLASPHFGERWGRHWLDVARYAESTGKEFNFTYPHAWPYRNYVIGAFNEDKPYDRFVREQIAGDILSTTEKPPGDNPRIATGFLAIGPKRLDSGGDGFRQDIVDDQIDTTTQAILGLTVACARCHDHKFDPIPTEDYYALAGIFLSTETLYGTIKQKYSNNPAGLIVFGPDAQQRLEAYQAYEQKIAEVSDERNQVKAELEKLQKESEESENQQKEKHEAGGQQDKTHNARVDELKQKVETLGCDLWALEESKPPRPLYAMGVKEGKNPQESHVAISGNFSDQGVVVPRGFLKAVDVDDSIKVNPTQSGRLALARWLTSQNNPLTARVMVNRIWYHLFGRGLVDSLNNFGALGERPTHPQLLDYLAVEFMDRGWSVKQMIRMIVFSHAYQLSSQRSANHEAVDPEDLLRWRMSPRRLDVEALRDAMLAVSGQLDPSVAAGSPVTELGDQLVRRIPLDKLMPPSNRRSVYLPIVRNYEPEMLERFDFAASSLVIGRRAVTTVPAQALYLLNSDFVREQSDRSARRLLAEDLDDPSRVALAYMLTVSRRPTDAELREALHYVREVAESLAQQGKTPGETRVAAWDGFCQALLANAEFRYLIDPRVHETTYE